MSDLTKSTDMDFEATSLQRCILIKDPDLVAGEALTKGMPCYIKSDGKVYKSVSTVATISNLTDCHGFAYDTYAIGDKVVLVADGGKMLYTAASGITPGAPYYVSDTAGKVSDAALVANDPPIALGISDTCLMISIIGRSSDVS